MYQGTCRKCQEMREMKVFFILHFIKSIHAVVIINKKQIPIKLSLKKIFLRRARPTTSFFSVGGLGLLKFLIS